MGWPLEPARVRQPGTSTAVWARHRLRVAPVLLVALGACYPRPMDPVGLDLPPPPFERSPYLQQVDSSFATILWMTDGLHPDTLYYRVGAEGSEWLAVPGSQHRRRSRVAGLGPVPPGSRVEYRVAAAGVRMGPYAFVTAPKPSAEETVRLLMFGDSGWGGEEQVRLAAHMRLREWDLAIHTGDLAYDDASERELTRRHFHVYGDLLAAVPFFPAIGNHDVRADGGASYEDAFAWRPPRPAARYYAFRWGAVQFVALDTSSPHDDTRGLREGTGRQYDWLKATLRAAAADSAVRWTVVYGHHPTYSHALGVSGHGSDRGLRKHLAPLYERYGVDLVVAGHDHHYERMHPIREGRPVSPGCGPVYVVTGGGGASRYARDVQGSSLVVRHSRAYHFVAVRITADGLAGEAIDDAGRIVDTFLIPPFSSSPADEACGP